jgi:hypothetical protein
VSANKKKNKEGGGDTQAGDEKEKELEEEIEMTKVLENKPLVLVDIKLTESSQQKCVGLISKQYQALERDGAEELLQMLVSECQDYDYAHAHGTMR